MPLDDLRIIILNERESGRLSDVPPNLHGEVRDRLASLQEQVYASEDPLSDEAQGLMEEVKAIREIVRDIFRIRSRKILSLALVRVESETSDREELKKMVPAEREMYDRIIQVLEAGKSALAGPGPKAGVIGPVPPGAPEPGGTGMAEPSPPAGEPMVLVRVLSDLEPFVGVDGRIYHLRREDLVTLPSRNAAVLTERNIALNIMPGK